jgi:hypothetical protein
MYYKHFELLKKFGYIGETRQTKEAGRTITNNAA